MAIPESFRQCRIGHKVFSVATRSLGTNKLGYDMAVTETSRPTKEHWLVAQYCQRL